MKFGNTLAAEMHPPYAEGYVRYNEMKSSIAQGEAGFGEKLRKEVERVADFGDKLRREATEKLNAAEKRWRDVQEWKRSSFPDVDKDIEKCRKEFDEIAEEVKRILDFVALNVTGIKKICKKHDRRTGEVSGPLLLSKLQRDAETAYLDRLSDTASLESLVTRCLIAQDEVIALLEKSGKEHVKRRELFLAGGSDYFTIPRSREVSTFSSTESGSGTPPILDERLTQNCVEALAKPLLSEERPLPAERPWTAFCGAILSGIGVGGLWTICQVVLTPWAAATAVLVSSCGSITGTRPALSSMYSGSFALAGACAALLFSTYAADEMQVNERHPFLGMTCAWLAGACVGAWSVQIPRQLVSNSGSPAWTRALITLAPILGSCIGASMLLLVQLEVSIFARWYGVGWLVFFAYVSLWRPIEPSDAEGRSREDTRASTLTEDEDVETTAGAGEVANKAQWQRVSSHVITLGVLASLAIDRTVRTVVALEVVSFYPALWGEDFFLLSIGSILASFVGVVVPSWSCAMIGCLSIYLLNGPGFIAWLWVEASCRNDLANFSEESASQADTILYVADFVACVIFALELSFLETSDVSTVGLTFASGLLLLTSSLGRLIAYRL